MPVGFGFSIDDVISGLQLLRNSIEAVNSVNGSSVDYITYELLSHVIKRSSSIVSLFKVLENIRIDA
jgi:hypothetical protein